MQLLKITSIPMKVELNIEKPQLEYRQSRPELQIQAQPARLNIRSSSVKLTIDTYEGRRSLGQSGPVDASREAAARGREIAAQAAADYSEMGRQMMEIQKDGSISNILFQRLQTQPQTEIVYLPSVAACIEWIPGELKMEYEPGDLSIDLEKKETEGHYQPGHVGLEVAQYNRLEIEYLGSPVYVPPSADPLSEDKKR